MPQLPRAQLLPCATTDHAKGLASAACVTMPNLRIGTFMLPRSAVIIAMVSLGGARDLMHELLMDLSSMALCATQSLDTLAHTLRAIQ